MKIGFCYDTMSDYNFTDLNFCDFTSEESVSYVKEVLESCGHKVTLIGNAGKLFHRMHSGQFDFNLVFSTAEGLGSRNREGWIASFLEASGIPYVGTDAYGLALTLDKIQTKLIAKYLNIPTPSFKGYSELHELENAVDQIKLPLVMKPNYEGSSMGVYLINSTEEFLEKGKQILELYRQKILVEDYLPGKEVTVSVIEIDGTAQVVGMAQTVSLKGETMPIFSSEAKRIYGCQKIKPVLPDYVQHKLEKYAIQLFQYIGCRDYCRVDFRFDKQGTPNLLEVTPLPAMGENASFTAGALLYKHSPQWLFDHIIGNAAARYSLLPKP